MKKSLALPAELLFPERHDREYLNAQQENAEGLIALFLQLEDEVPGTWDHVDKLYQVHKEILRMQNTNANYWQEKLDQYKKTL